MTEEITALRQQVRDLESTAQSIKIDLGIYRNDINELTKRTELQQRIIDGLNNGAIKRRGSANLDGYSKTDDHNPYPKE